MISTPYRAIFGIRHKRLFNFMGLAGRVIDKLIAEYPHADNEPLTFSQIGWKENQSGVRVINKDGNYSVESNIDGIILDYHFLKDDSVTLDQLWRRFSEISKVVLREVEAHKLVTRIGMIRSYAFDSQTNAADELISKLLTSNIKGLPDSFKLRFAFKNVTPNSLVHEGTADYTNAILNIQSERSSTKQPSYPDIIDVSIDYQTYFNPERTFSTDIVEKHYRDFDKLLDAKDTLEIIDFGQKDGEDDKKIL